MTSYSLVEHLSKAIWFSKWLEGHFAVFSAYFDASGDEADKESKFVTVGGFIAHADRWIEWEKEWLACLEEHKLFDKYGVPEFHMVECANYRHSFDGWREREPERQAILQKLEAIISRYLGQKESCTISIEDYKKYLDEGLRRRFGIAGAYSIGARACASRVKEWCERAGVPISRVQFFFERGERGHLERALQEHFIYPKDIPRPNFGWKRHKRSKNGSIIEERLVPFQAADVLAYLSNTEAKFSNRQDWGDKENIRWMLQALSHIPEPNITFSPSRMQALNRLLRAAEPRLPRPRCYRGAPRQ